MAIITGTMFLRTRIEPNSVLNGSMYMSVCFYSVMIMMFNGLTEMTIAVRRCLGASPLYTVGSIIGVSALNIKALSRISRRDHPP